MSVHKGLVIRILNRECNVTETFFENFNFHFEQIKVKQSKHFENLKVYTAALYLVNPL